MKTPYPILNIAILLSILSCNNPSQKQAVSPRINHVMLYVTDLEQSIAFYTNAFDLKVANRLNQLEVIQPDGTTTTREVTMAFLKFAGQDFVYELSQHPKDTVKANQVPLFQHIGIDVTNIEAAYQRAIDAGGEVIAPVRTVKAKNVEAKQAFIKGPDGERIELMQLVAGEF